MSTSPGSSASPKSSIWFNMGTILFILVLAALFFIFASAKMHREFHDPALPAQDVPPPGPVVPH